MNKMIMAIGAHPDDIEFGCGGTLIRHVEDGDTVVYVCMTNTVSIDGTTKEVLRTVEENERETNLGATELGAKYVHRLPFTDLHVPFSFESISEVEKLIKHYNPNTIYTHWAGDANQDHIATFRITMAAARYTKNIYCYEQIPIPRLTENQMDVDYYVNITNQFCKKLKAAEHHRSQMEKYRMNVGIDVADNLRTMARYRGIQANCRYAEAFKVIKQVW